MFLKKFWYAGEYFISLLLIRVGLQAYNKDYTSHRYFHQTIAFSSFGCSIQFSLSNFLHILFITLPKHEKAVDIAATGHDTPLLNETLIRNKLAFWYFILV